MEIGHALEGQWLRVPEILVGGVGLGREERAVWGEHVQVADRDGEQLEGEGDGGVAA